VTGRVAESVDPTFWNSVRLTFGAGSLESLPQVFAELPGRRALVVAGRAAMREQGVLNRIQRLLDGWTLSFYEGVEPNPTVRQAQEAADFARGQGVEAVLGIGGGSALDVAKTVAAALPNGGEVAPLLAEHPPLAPSLPAVLVPATAGTGSEVTRWATLWDRDARKKHSLEGAGMYPAHAVLDPLLTLTQSPQLTAVAGMDALSHAMEAYWNRNANPRSDAYALEAVRAIVETLPRAVEEPDNPAHREGMLRASLQAGLAFSNTKTAAAHSLSYPMTLYYGVAHGQATSITLPALLCFNAEASPARMADLARAVGGESVTDGAERLRGLLRRVGLKTSLRELGIDADGIEVCVREGYTPDRAGNNLRALNAESLRALLRSVA